MTYIVRYSKQIDWKRFRALSMREKKRMQEAIERKIAVDPVYYGKPLRKSLFGCRSLRVGAYRIIYRVEGKVVEIVLIGHRSTVYSDATKVL